MLLRLAVQRGEAGPGITVFVRPRARRVLREPRTTASRTQPEGSGGVRVSWWRADVWRNSQRRRRMPVDLPSPNRQYRHASPARGPTRRADVWRNAHAAAACRLICRAQTVNTGMLLRLAVQRGEAGRVSRSSLDREPEEPSGNHEPLRAHAAGGLWRRSRFLVVSGCLGRNAHAAAACRLICRAQTVNTGMLLRLAVQRGERMSGEMCTPPQHAG